MVYLKLVSKDLIRLCSIGTIKGRVAKLQKEDGTIFYCAVPHLILLEEVTKAGVLKCRNFRVQGQLSSNLGASVVKSHSYCVGSGPRSHIGACARCLCQCGRCTVAVS